MRRLAPDIGRQIFRPSFARPSPFSLSLCLSLSLFLSFLSRITHAYTHIVHMIHMYSRLAVVDENIVERTKNEAECCRTVQRNWELRRLSDISRDTSDIGTIFPIAASIRSRISWKTTTSVKQTRGIVQDRTCWDSRYKDPSWRQRRSYCRWHSPNCIDL